MHVQGGGGGGVPFLSLFINKLSTSLHATYCNLDSQKVFKERERRREESEIASLREVSLSWKRAVHQHSARDQSPRAALSWISSLAAAPSAYFA